MKKLEAIKAVKRAALQVRAIYGAEYTTGSDPMMNLEVKHGRTIGVETAFGDQSGCWYNTRNEDRVGRVLLKAGRMGIGCSAQQVTRTFKVRKDGTLNEAGMIKALQELAGQQQDDVIRQDAHEAKAKRNRDQREMVIRHLAKATGKFSSEHYGLMATAMLEAYPFEMRVRVKENGSIKVEMDNVSVPTMNMLLVRLGFLEKEPDALKSDV